MQTPAPSAEALSEDQLEALRTVRFQLASQGYCEPGLRERLGMPEGLLPSLYLDRLENAHVVFPAEGPSPLDLLLSLLLLGDSVERESAWELLSPEAWEALIASGLIVSDGAALRATACVVPVFGVWALCDFRARRGERDFVFFPDHSTATAARYVEGGSASGELALDVGTGSGALALLHARLGRHRRVLGQDLNPRSVALARLAAVLSDVSAGFEVVRADALATRAPASVDLLTFTLPQIYTAHFTHAVSVHAEHGDRLLDEVYGALDRILTSTGEAVLFHQARSPAADELPRRLAGVTGRAALRIEHSSLPNKLVNAEFGLSHVRRRREGEEDFLHFESQQLEVDRQTVDAWRETEALLRSGDWMSAVISLRPGLLVQDGYVERDGRLLPIGRAIEGLPVEPELCDVLFRIDGTRTVAEVLGAEDSVNHRAAFQRALRRGELRLTRRRP